MSRLLFFRPACRKLASPFDKGIPATDSGFRLFHQVANNSKASASSFHLAEAFNRFSLLGLTLTFVTSEKGLVWQHPGWLLRLPLTPFSRSVTKQEEPTYYFPLKSPLWSNLDAGDSNSDANFDVLLVWCSGKMRASPIKYLNPIGQSNELFSSPGSILFVIRFAKAAKVT